MRGSGVRHEEDGGEGAGKRLMRMPFSCTAVHQRVVAFVDIKEIHEPGRPRDNSNAAAAHHETAEASVQTPHALSIINV